MEVTLTPIGNSKGIRIPQTLIKQLGFKDTVKLTIKQRSLVLSPSQPRRSWSHAFISSQPTEPEFKSFTQLTNDFDRSEWQW